MEMVKELIKTFEYLPKVKGEHTRELIMRDLFDLYELRLGIYDGELGEWNWSSFSFSASEVMYAKFDFEDYAIKRVCEQMEHYLRKNSNQ